MKVLYLQFCGRVIQDKHLVACALYSNKELTNIKTLDVCQMTNYEANKQNKFDVYRNRLAEYAGALKVIYKYQKSIIDSGYDCIVLCPSNTKLWKWLSGERVPSQIKELYESINKQFRVDGQFQLDISVGLSEFPTDKKTYKFCNEKYIGARLTKLKRGIHIMTAEEVQHADELKMQQKLEKDAISDEEGVSIYDILQLNCGDDLEPDIIFTSNNS